MKLYGIFWHESGRAMWALNRNRRVALRYAKSKHGIVSMMPEPSGGGAWDAPTFRACSDVIADFREGVNR